MDNTVKTSSNYTLSETGDMIGRMTQIIEDYCHLAGTGPYERTKSQLKRMQERIREEEERRQEAFFNTK